MKAKLSVGIVLALLLGEQQTSLSSLPLERRFSMLDPIQELMDEHRIIEKVLTALTAAADQEVPLEFYERAVDFIANFADKCHHSKEEERLFPVLEEKGIPREAGPIGCMCEEHEIGRGHVQAIRELIKAGDLAGLRRESLNYVGLLRSHIQNKDLKSL
jgi:hemerythrin-like domain-containing protein